MSESEQGGRGRFFGRRKRREIPDEEDAARAEDQSTSDERPPDSPLIAGGIPDDDAEAQRRREAVAEAIQLARERAIAESTERQVRDQADARKEIRESVLAALNLWTDSHCHIQYAPDDAEAANIVERAAASGTRRMISVGTDVASSQRAIELAARLSRSGALKIDVYATVGLHPHDATTGVEGIRKLLSDLSVGIGDGSRVVAVGECGLDYHYDHSPRAAQRTVFAAQVALANEYDLALVIHTARHSTTPLRSSTPRVSQNAPSFTASPADLPMRSAASRPVATSRSRGS